MRRTWGHVLVCLLGLGCGLQPYTSGSAGGSEGTSSTGDGASTGDATLGGSVTGAVTAATTGIVEETGGGSTTGEADSTTDAVATCDLVGEETGVEPLECDIWTQDCPEGCKCAPYSGDGDNSHEASKCVPVLPNAGSHQEPCTVEEGGVSGVDSCAEGFMCWSVDPETGIGTCHAQCMGAPWDAFCTEPLTYCHVWQDGLQGLCFPGCHPLDDPCADGDTCVPNPMDPNSFICVIDASGQEGQAFDVCEFANACEPGLMCANPVLAEECDQAAAGCCLPFCDLKAPNCPGVGQECLPWYEEGMAPAGFEELGVCGVPQ